jgi:hypothetical protein
MHDDAACMAILFSSFFETRTDGGGSYAAGGPREELANKSGEWTRSKSGLGASQATRKTGVTMAVTALGRQGSGPT